MNAKMKQILDQGMYGTPETKPEERKIFLSTILERIHIALTKRQVIHQGMYDQAVDTLKTKPNIRLFINGNLGYHLYSNYVKEATTHGVPFTVVTPTDDTPIGIVLANENELSHASNIFIEDKFYHSDIEEHK